MSRSKILATACSTALFGAAATLAQQANPPQESQQSPRQQSTQQPKQVHNQVAKKAGQPTNVLVTGKIIDTRDVTLAATAGDKHRLFRVKTNAGRDVVVDIGVPKGEVMQADFEKGDRIVAMGKPARINGRPVLFAASIAEMEQVHRGKSSSVANQDPPQSQSPSTQSKDQQAGSKSSTQRTAANEAVPDAVIVFFETENLGRDDYGYYDRDFAWTTKDRGYEDWNDTSAWNDEERAHYDIFGYDDAGEAGLWDW